MEDPALEDVAKMDDVFGIYELLDVKRPRGSEDEVECLYRSAR